MILTIIIGVFLILGLAYLTSKEKWDNNTIPPKGFGHHKGKRFRL